MAGNTKLMGFTPEGKVQLERWGGTATVMVSPESVAALRNACYSELPKKPGGKSDLDVCHVSYDEHVGRVHVELDIDSAALLADCLESSSGFEKYEELESWSGRLKKAIQAHYDYHNREGEPGVTDDA